ncbi:5-methyltetrahydropteroyltriglutamate--homocysteine S-methyltransferase [Marinibaculum pumilum]|uniref:5-methyltetrahydropteroyltriglutamate--homocysteine S-methyltransferase n=1 Tax=Marinibaculum pumilum TaxID=1766165 RepID=A0ABV7L5C5_9PROT
MTSHNGRPPFRADHVGSLLRPPALKDAFRRRRTGDIEEAEFQNIQDEAIRAVVRLQEDAGLQVVTDGEFRRGSYWGRFVERLEGLEIRPAIFRFHDEHGHEQDFTAPYAAAKVRRVQPLAVDEFDFVKGVTSAMGKITLPAPSTLHFYRCSDFAAAEAYDSAESLFADLTAAYRAEIADLVAAGCRYLQFDEVAVAMLCDPAIRDQVKAVGQDPDALVGLYIGAINAAVRDVPDGVAVGIHMCRGNFKGLYLSEGGYESVAGRFFGETDVNHFLLEYDTDRAGDFQPLRHVPKDKGVVLGLVSSKSPELESVETLQRRTDEATRHIDLGQLALGPQCGFASTVAGNPVTEEIERAKLARIVEAAGKIWG